MNAPLLLNQAHFNRLVGAHLATVEHYGNLDHATIDGLWFASLCPLATVSLR